MKETTQHAYILLRFLAEEEGDSEGYVEITEFLTNKGLAEQNILWHIYSYLTKEPRYWAEFSPHITVPGHVNRQQDFRLTVFRARITQAGKDEVDRRRMEEEQLALTVKQNESFEKIVQTSVDSAAAAKRSAIASVVSAGIGLVSAVIAFASFLSARSDSHELHRIEVEEEVVRLLKEQRPSGMLDSVRTATVPAAAEPYRTDSVAAKQQEAR